MTEYNMVVLGERIETAIAEDARKRQIELAGTRRDPDAPSGQLSGRGETRDEVARITGLGSGRTYERHKR